MNIRWNEDATIAIERPSRPKKLTATRFAAVLGISPWATPFQMWCEITRAWCKPYEETIYTQAGKVIEPRQIAYMRHAYGMDDLYDPTDLYGSDYFSRTHGDFFDHPVFGGMWDAITKNEDGTVTSVLEFKTTQRVEDWAADIPSHYALQAALYAWLLGCDDVIMVVTFLQPHDYDDPTGLVLGAENTATYEYSLAARYPDFERTYVQSALDWWRDHVETGVSPTYDEQADAEYLKGLRNAYLSPTTDIESLMEEYAALNDLVSEHDNAIVGERKRMESIRRQLKDYALAHIDENKTATLSQGRVSCKLTRLLRHTIDEQALKADGLYDRYLHETESSRLEIAVSNSDKDPAG